RDFALIGGAALLYKVLLSNESGFPQRFTWTRGRNAAVLRDAIHGNAVELQAVTNVTKVPGTRTVAVQRCFQEGPGGEMRSQNLIARRTRWCCVELKGGG
ncbi:MAG: hypothetical protein ACXWVP_11770, partial [Burkholderiales bacterium]